MNNTSSTQQTLKQQAALAALDYVSDDMYVGIGTGSTVQFFIEGLAERMNAGQLRIKGTVSSSEASTALLQSFGIEVLDLNQVGELDVYVDGADEINHHLHMIKGGGAALTREKIIAQSSKLFVCIADESKYVQALGAFGIPVEVLPMARSAVARALTKLGASPVLRDGRTDNGGVILDIKGMLVNEPVALESEINQIPGVITCGLFARRRADVLLLATNQGVQTYR
jgi:ribose 5-phosphate isomerase A